MKAITVEPHKPETARLEDIAEPDARGGSVLVEAIAVGVCGTDVEIVEGKYGWAPQGKTRLVLGHESLGRVIDPGPNSSLKEGDLVAGIVRRPDPVPCPNCAVGEWDMCRNGQYTERGIKEIDGFMSERWRVEPEYVVKIDPSLGMLGVLLEPTTVVAKAWEQVRMVGQRAFWEPRTVLVTGAGPIGLLAALIGKKLGLEVHVLDRIESGAKPEIVRALGATYHAGALSGIGFQPDVIIECTGVGQVIVDSIQTVGAWWCGVPHGCRERRAHRAASRRPTRHPTSSSATTSWSGASTRTSDIGTRRRSCWHARTTRGWSASSRGVSLRPNSSERSHGSRMTSRSSSSSRKPDRRHSA